jgi:hypothetical protein
LPEPVGSAAAAVPLAEAAARIPAGKEAPIVSRNGKFVRNPPASEQLLCVKDLASKQREILVVMKVHCCLVSGSANPSLDLG